ncbi:MAG: NfeD family protein [Verrucomicrobiota bacterium]
MAAIAPAQAALGSLAGKSVVIEVGEYAFTRYAETKWILETLELAEKDGAASVVFDISTTGGLARPTFEMIEKVTAMGIPTIAVVDEQAAGPGALLALAADNLVLGRGADLGGEIAEFEWREKKDELPPRLVDRSWNDEMDSILKAFEPRQRPVSVIRGLVDPRAEVRINGKLVAGESDTLLLEREMFAGPFEGDGVIELLDAKDIEGALEGLKIDGDLQKLHWEKPAEEEVVEESPVEDEDPVEVVVNEGETGDIAEAEAEEEAFGKTRTENYEGRVVVIDIGDETLIRGSKFDFLQRVIKKADEDGAEAIIFEMNTPGGLAWDTAEVMMKDLSDVKIPTYTFINPSAVSAGSLIAVATDHIYMHRPSNIGSAGIVTAMGDLEGTMKQKAESLFKSVGRGVARAKGHPEDVVEAFIVPEKEVKREVPFISSRGFMAPKELVISPEGEMLNLDADQASQLIDGKPLLAKGIAQTVEEVIEKEGLKGEIIRAEPLGFEMVGDWLVKMSGWLLIFGIAGAYMELKAPGFGLPGAISLLCFGLFFFGNNVAGNLAGYEAIGILVLGIILVIVEFYVFPGLLIPGLLGFLLIIGSLVYSMIGRFDLQGESGTFEIGNLGEALRDPLMTMTWALGGAVVLILMLLRFLPSSPMFKWASLNEALPSGASIGQSEGTTENGNVEVELEGVAMTDLRPAGKAQFGNDVRDVVTGGEFIESGTKVRVVKQSGLRTVVEELV